MDNRKRLATGIIGTAVTAVCCFTPVLVVAFGALGLSAALAWADFVLFPALGLFVALTAYAGVKEVQCRRQKRQA